MNNLTLFDLLRMLEYMPFMGRITVSVYIKGYELNTVLDFELSGFYTISDIEQYYLRDVCVIKTNIGGTDGSTMFDVWIY